MSVTVRHLNADSSFLLIFSPKPEPNEHDLCSVEGAFSVLIDPWLVGSSIVNAKWFAISQRLVPSAIKHISELEEPDVVLVSQNKPDHCHKDTLLQLRSDGKTLIAAEPGAAKAIKSWNHFDPNRVHALTKYDARVRFGNTLRLRVPPLGPNGMPGELNIAFIPARNYVTGLHNAFGITYQPPTRVRALAPVMTIDLPRNDLSVSLTAASLPPQSPQAILSPNCASPVSTHVRTTLNGPTPRPGTAPQIQQQWAKHRPHLSRPSNTQSSEFLPFRDQPSVKSSEEDLASSKTAARSATTDIFDVNFDSDALIDTNDFANTLPTPPLSPSVSSTTLSPDNSDISDTSPLPQSASTNTSFSQSASFPDSPLLHELQSRYSRPPTIRPGRPKAISILYSPHGIPLPDLQSYIKTHLVPLPGALPLTCLFHSFQLVKNPWWFGGNIMMGADGGIEIAKALMAKCWVSAHDEDKDDRGVAVKLLKCDKINADAVREKIMQVDDRWDCDVRSLDVGVEVCLSSYKWEKKGVSSDTVGLGVEMPQFQSHNGG